MRIAELDNMNQDLLQQHRGAILEIQRLDRDLKQVLQVNEAFTLQASDFQKREYQYQELTKDYRERMESLKLDQERIALKEQQFLR